MLKNGSEVFFVWFQGVGRSEPIVGESARSRKASMVAVRWLVGRFKESLEWPSKVLMAEAIEAGISESALWEAKKFLDLPKAMKRTTEDGKAAWVWWVSPEQLLELEAANVTDQAY